MTLPSPHHERLADQAEHAERTARADRCASHEALVGRPRDRREIPLLGLKFAGAERRRGPRVSASGATVRALWQLRLSYPDIVDDTVVGVARAGSATI